MGTDPRAGAERPARDVVEVGGLAAGRTLVKVTSVGPEVRVIDEPTAGQAPERHRDQVEAHELHVEQQIAVGDAVAHEEAPIGEPRVEALERVYTRSLTASYCSWVVTAIAA